MVEVETFDKATHAREYTIVHEYNPGVEIIRDDEDADVEYGTVLEFEVDELVVCSSMELDDGKIREDVV